MFEKNLKSKKSFLLLVHCFQHHFPLLVHHFHHHNYLHLILIHPDSKYDLLNTIPDTHPLVETINTFINKYHKDKRASMLETGGYMTKIMRRNLANDPEELAAFPVTVTFVKVGLEVVWQ